MKKNVCWYRLCSWLKHQLTAWNTGGEGVHSPYLFEWVRMVMSDKHEYYVWKEIEAIREEMLRDLRMVEYVDYGSAMRRLGAEARDERRVKDIARGSLAKKKYAQMLYRLINWLGHQLRAEDKGLTIIELGTSLGVTTAYLAGVDGRDKVVSFEGCESVAKLAQENWKRLGLSNVECRVGKIELSALAEVEKVDVAFVDANHTYEASVAYFDILASKVHEKSVIVMDDIHHSEEMECVWREICGDARVTSTIDLFQMGLVFFDKHYWRRNYRMRI